MIPSEDRRTYFDLFAPESMQVARSCMHVGAEFPWPGCVECSLTLAVKDAIDHGHLFDLTIQDGPHPEFGVWGRRVRGWYVDDSGRLVVQRIIAWLHGHPDPLDLLARGLAGV